MSIASEYDAVACDHHKELMDKRVWPVGTYIHNGKLCLQDRSARHVHRLIKQGWDTLQIAILFNVHESAVVNGIYLYRKYEKELTAGVGAPSGHNRKGRS